MTLLSLVKCLASDEVIIIIDNIYYSLDKKVFEGTIEDTPKEYFEREVFQIMPVDDGKMYVMLFESKGE